MIVLDGDKKTLSFAATHWKLTDIRFVRTFENTVYQAKKNGERVYLRITPRSRRSQEEIESEIAILQYLNQHNFPANAPIETRNGDLFLSTDVERHRYFLVLFTECAGEDYSNQIGTSDYTFYQDCGEIMGRLHKLLYEFPMKSLMQRHSWQSDRWENFAQIVSPSEETAWSEHEKIKRWWQNIAGRFETQLIHGDFTIRNMRYANTVSLFDFDGCCEHYIGYEIGCFLHHFRHLQTQSRLRIVSNFLRGYSEQNDLSDELIETIPMFCRMKLLRSYMVLQEEVATSGNGDRLTKTIIERRKELDKPSPWEAVLNI